MLRRSFQPDGLALLADSILDRPADDAPLRGPFGLAFLDEEPPIGAEGVPAFVADKALVVPLAAQGRDDDVVENRLLAPHAASCCPTGVAAETPCESVFLHEGGFLCEGLYIVLVLVQHFNRFLFKRKTYITTFGAEEMTNVPFGATCNHNFALDRRLAALASRAEQLVKIQMAVESHRLGFFVIFGCVGKSFRSLGLWFLVESNAFQLGFAMIASEAFGMEP